VRVPDDRVLELTASEGRVLVSHDWETMPYHFAEFIAAHTSPGLLIIPQHLGVRAAIEQLVMVWAASEAEGLRGIGALGPGEVA
jgi:hypothetical protein